MSRTLLITAALLCVFLLAACGSSSSQPDPNSDNDSHKHVLIQKAMGSGERTALDIPPDASGDYVFTWDLIAGQNQLAGTVDIALSPDEVCVTYNLNAGFEISEAQLYVGLTPPDPKGNPGTFPYKESFDPPVSTWTYCVDLADLGAIDECCDGIYVATHATSYNQTIWGGRWNNGSPSYEFNWARKWGGYFSVMLLPNPSLPADPVWYKGFYPGTNCYWGIDFEDGITYGTHSFPAGDWTVSPDGNRWCGWCADVNTSMYSNTSYKVTLYSSLDPSIPAFGQNANWDKVNYLINMRNLGTGIYAPYAPALVPWKYTIAFQEVIWYYINGRTMTGTTAWGAGDLALSQAMRDDADANGDNFVPGCEDYYAVVLYPGNADGFFSPKAQMNIVEVLCGNAE